MNEDYQAAERLPVLFRGVRLTCSTLPSSRKLDAQTTQELAEHLGASPAAIRVAKKLFASNEPAIKALRQALREVQSWFRDPRYTLPWPEPGVRLVKHKQLWYDEKYPVVSRTKHDNDEYIVVYRDNRNIERSVRISKEENDCLVQNTLKIWHQEMMRRIENVKNAAAQLKQEMPAIIERQRELQGTRAFNPEDYNFDVTKLGHIEVSFPMLAADPALEALDPATFLAEQRRYEEAYQVSIRQEKQRLAENMVLVLDGLANALTKRRLFRGFEVISTSENDDTVTVQYNDAEGEIQTITLAKAEAMREITTDTKIRRFHKSTVAKLYAAIQEARQRKEDIGLEFAELDNAIARLEEIVTQRDAQTLAEDLRKGAASEAIARHCVAIASTLLESNEMVPRRAVLRKRLKVVPEKTVEET